MKIGGRQFLRAILVICMAVCWAGCGSDLETERTSDYSRIRIRKQGDVRTMIFVRDDGREVVESRLNLQRPYDLQLPYTREMFGSYLLQPEQQRVLIIGLGGGAMPHFLKHYEPDLTVDVVEIDPVIVQLADDYFKIRSGERVNIITADGLEYLEQTEHVYDVIYLDAFVKPSSDTDGAGVPRRLKTKAFFQLLHEKLQPDGLAAFNLNVNDEMQEDIRAMDEVFSYVTLLRVPRRKSFVAIAAKSGPRPDDSVLQQRAEELDARFQATFSFGDVLQNFVDE